MILSLYNVDTLNICMKEFIIFVCTDSTEIFSKLRSAGLNYNLPCFFTDSYCAVGVSNKHCLLTFFIYTTYISVDLAHHEIFVLKLLRRGIRSSSKTHWFW